MTPKEYGPELETLVHKFEDAWCNGQRPRISDYLPDRSGRRHEILVELVHIDLEYRCKKNDTVRVEQYLEQFPELRSDTKVLAALVAAEFLLRKRNDPGVDRREYLQRFPELKEDLPVQMGQMATLSDIPGTVCQQIPGYEILDELGRGGMGVVYKARQVSLNRLVALKMLLAGAHASPRFIARFRIEAEAAARLQHPSIVQVYDFDTHEGLPFFSMELVEGASLSKKLRTGAVQPTPAARLMVTLALAVGFAHGRGVVHRDLKPSNILLTPDGAPKISDFGLAKLLDAATPLTQTGDIMGTPYYMSPEQAAGKKAIGPATDIYALGAILYEMLAGKTAFQGATPLEILDKVRSQDPEPLREVNASIPRDLESICLKCLAKNPTRRYGSAELLADDLRRFVASKPITAEPAASSYTLAAEDESRTVPQPAKKPNLLQQPGKVEKKHHQTIRVGLTLVLVSFCLVGAVLAAALFVGLTWSHIKLLLTIPEAISLTGYSACLIGASSPRLKKAAFYNLVWTGSALALLVFAAIAAKVLWRSPQAETYAFAGLLCLYLLKPYIFVFFLGTLAASLSRSLIERVSTCLVHTGRLLALAGIAFIGCIGLPTAAVRFGGGRAEQWVVPEFKLNDRTGGVRFNLALVLAAVVTISIGIYYLVTAIHFVRLLHETRRKLDRT